ncbi:MAG: hypothetical protein RLZZ312_88 [Bacteroidota bacterium]|jgi:hypothetical protein
MNRFIVIIVMFINFGNQIVAQNHEFGIFAGGSNFIGDVGNDKYIYPNETAYGFVYKWNIHPRYSWRASYIQSKITGNDQSASDARRQFRGLRFDNYIKEVAIGFEFNFNDFDLNTFDKHFTPYIVASISYVHYNKLYFPTNIAKFDNTRGTVGVPMIVGIKHNILPRWIIAAEVGARYTFADDIDGSYPTDENLRNLKFGNLNSKDWFVFTGITLTYTFGNEPCYCVN